MGSIFEALYGSDRTKEPKAEPEKKREVVSDKPQVTRVDNHDYGYEDVIFASSVISSIKWWRDLKKIAVTLSVMAEKKKAKSNILMFSGLSRKNGTTVVAEGIVNLLWQEHPDQRFLIVDIRVAQGRNETSLMDLFVNDVEPKAILDTLKVGGVHRVFAGTPTKDVNIYKLREFLIGAKDQFDWIILDVPPFFLSPINDSLGRIAEGIVLVANAGSTRVPALNALADEIGQLGINILGVVLNRRRYPIPKFLLRFM